MTDGGGAAGRTLLLRVVENYLETPTVSWAHEYLGDAAQIEGQYAEAERHFRDALGAHARIRGIRGYAQPKLAALIALSRQRSKYPEAAALLDTYKPVWKIERFWVLTARARMANDLGTPQQAATYALEALAIEADKSPQSAQHPEIGQVSADKATLRELRSMIAQPTGSGDCETR